MKKLTFKDMLSFALYCAVAWGAMQVLIYFLGELHGVIATVVMLMVQTSFLLMRVGILERQLKESHGSDSWRAVQKSA